MFTSFHMFHLSSILIIIIHPSIHPFCLPDCPVLGCGVHSLSWSYGCKVGKIPGLLFILYYSLRALDFYSFGWQKTKWSNSATFEAGIHPSVQRPSDHLANLYKYRLAFAVLLMGMLMLCCISAVYLWSVWRFRFSPGSVSACWLVGTVT